MSLDRDYAREMVNDLLHGVLRRNPSVEHEALTIAMVSHDINIMSQTLTEVVMAMDLQGMEHDAPSVVLRVWTSIVEGK